MNTILKLIMVCLLFTIIFSCKKENLQRTFTASTQPLEKAIILNDSIYLGAHYGGGVIFYIDKTGQHGLISDTADLGFLAWLNGTITVTGAKATGLGTGMANTRKIIQSQGTVGNYAALACAKLRRGGYNDWYLPSKDELAVLHKRKQYVGYFADNEYWSSSEITETSVWAVYFFDGEQINFGKVGANFVRAIRAF